VCAWDRVEAHAAARKLVAIAEVFRRNPEDGFEPEPGQMPGVVHEFTRDQLALALGESRYQADGLLTTAWHLATRLAGTLGALRDGIISRAKAEIIVRATAALEPGEAAAAEAMVLDRAGRLTPGGLRSAIARAVIEVAPEKARERRETAAKFARVERWTEDTGNAALMGRELPPDEVLAADQRICWWAGELRAAGLEGGMDELCARAFLDLLLGKDSRPRDGAGDGTAEPPGPGPAGGFAGRVNLTVPLGTAAGLADRPGELGGLGPVDPWLARDLVNAAARNPQTTWCVTVTDQHGHAVGHGCTRPEPGGSRKRAGPGPPGAAEFSFTPASRDGPPGGYGTWRLRTPGPGPDLIVAIDTLAIGDCDHRLESRATIPGSGCGTYRRSGTPPAPARSAGGPPRAATSSTTRRTRRADARACATAVPSAAMTTGSSSSPDGRSTSAPTAPSGGPPRPAAATTPNPPATPSSEQRTRSGLAAVAAGN
jgi:hypothetical protein